MFTNRIIVALAVLRLQPPHAALAVLCGVDRSTITRAAHGIRPLLAEGLAEQVPDQVQAAPLNSKKDAPPETLAAWGAARHQQSSVRIRVEHSNPEHKQWRTLLRYLGRREHVDEGGSGVAGLVSDRTPTR
ncbi:transposase family protein [Streptomyces sp. NBC_01460]|uniref:hypothetical protein n=1 Tax=Streptomyces sp. NBC_01460 TaxID=2903875 RepID=UPI002E30F398|nr:hypothetical protein [Streptomyces sp. NBC_01460]